MKKLLCVALLGLVASPAHAVDTLYDDLGGKVGLERIVDLSVDNYLTDPRIKDVFSESNIDRVRMELKDQFCQLAGGPCLYKGHDMTVTHKGLHLTNADFNALVEDLQDAMTKCDVSFATQNRLLALLAPMQHQVVSK